MRTLEDVLIEEGITPDAKYKCSVCTRSHPAFAVSVPDGAVTKKVRKITHHKPAPDHDPAKHVGREVRLIPVHETIEDVLVEVAVCTECIISADREGIARAEKSERERKAKDDPWGTELGKHVKAERNRLIDAANWAIQPDTSPLTAKSRAEHAAYVKKLHRLTLDNASPTSVTWPTPPTPAYQP